MNRNKNGTFGRGYTYRTPKPYWNKGWLSNEYITLKKSAYQIATENGCSENNILAFLKRFSIPTRTVSEVRQIKKWGLKGKKNGMYGRVKEQNPNWRGGISFEMTKLYTSNDWHKVCAIVWKRDNNTCQRCGLKWNEGMPFHVHHITHQSITDRLDASKSILLCKECHSWVHSKRNFKFEYLTGEIK